MGILGLGETWRRSRPVEPPVAKAPPAPARESEKLPRRFGDFLLTSRVGSDALGHVYRGLTLGETGDFVRVRLLDAPGLSREQLAETIRTAPPPLRRTPAQRPRGERLGLARGTAFLSWNEMHGWTLDALFRDLRRRGRRLPVEHVLLIIDGLAKALESGGPHGLVWPGFVSITRDGEARLGGFGLAPAILPALDAGNLSAALSPYMAPEALEERTASADGDVYSLAAIAIEALTDHPTPFAGLGRGAGADRLFPHDLARLLRTATGPRRQRFATPGDFRRELGQFMVGSGHLPSSFHFSRFLRDLDLPRETASGARRTGTPAATEEDTAMPDVPVVPVLEEAEIESVLQKFWGQIDK
ncbi:MAG: hypothetical protein ABR576_13530 [Thermoanaerobaculia bacterium]